MPVREFTDSQDIEWRAWDVTAEQLHPVTRMEDLMELSTGWLTFESEHEKRRLPSPYPMNWATLPLDELEALCRRAPAVVRRLPRNSGELRAVEVSKKVDEARRGSEDRTFHSPGGREWTVRLHECFDDVNRPKRVLRFTTQDIVVELDQWDDGWQNYSREQYAMMLLDANPPRRTGKSGPQRRASDRPQESSLQAAD